MHSCTLPLTAAMLSYVVARAPNPPTWVLLAPVSLPEGLSSSSNASLDDSVVVIILLSDPSKAVPFLLDERM